MKTINNPDAIYPSHNSLGWTFPIEIRDVATSHGYTTGCPTPATNAAKANGTVTIKTRTTPVAAATDLDSTALTALPVTALVNSGTSLEFTVYAGMAAGSYQMQATILVPDPDNSGSVIEFRFLENFQIVNKAI